jgi:predicted AAA+ superfamily ATPase
MSSQEAVLIIGASASGKSTLAKKWARKLEKPIYILMASELLKLDNLDEDIKQISWAEVLDISKSTIIVEDVLSLSKAQDKTLRHLIDVNIHHKKNYLIVLTHHVQGKPFLNKLTL